MKTWTCLVLGTVAAAAAGGVREQFADPPPDCKLQAWYHWTTTGLSDRCLAADLKAMGELGVGTAHVFVTGQKELPPGTKPLDPEWWKRWETAVAEAKKNGIRLGFHNCPGWSSSGGRWIRPEDSMKMLVASATDLTDLSKPVRLASPLALRGFYREVAVYAFPIAPPPAPVKVGGSFDADFEAFRAGKGVLTLPTAREDPPHCEVVFEYAEPIAPTSLVTSWDESQFHLDVEVLASADGEKWSRAAFHPYRLYNTQQTPKVLPLAMAAPARFFKLSVTAVEPPPWVGFVRRKLAKAEFSDLPLVDDLDNRNGASVAHGYRHPADPARPGLAKDVVVDVTAAFRDGVLDLSSASVPALPPSPCYRVLRVGYTTTGKCCAPAPDNVRGLECDKLSKRGLDAHWPHMPHRLIGAPGAKGTVAVAIVDSWEVGGQNWTEDFPDEFRRRRGYDIRPWLPAMVGYVVGTDGETARFLYDVQRTVSDLVCENYYDYFAEKCHAEGVLSATESYGGPFDSLRAFRAADVPTGEFWLGRTPCGSPRVAASAGHLNGRPCIGAEAFTTEAKEGRWQITPHELRVNGDRGWLEGVSQLVYHSYLQQPFDNVQPGFSLDRHGTQLNRHTTWWPEGRWWAKYVQRGQLLLQRGEPKADVLVFTGDSTPNACGYPDGLVRAGYDFDFMGPRDLERLEARDGGVAMPGRLAYAVLWLGNDRFLSSAALRKVKALVDGGARVAGRRPEGTPTLADDPGEWRSLVAELWDGAAGRIRPADSALAAARSFGVRAPVESGGALRACRRVIEGRDFYFVVNGGKAFDAEVSFEADGRPERWDCKTGKIEPLAGRADGWGRVKARLRLAPEESAFVSFRDPAEARPGDVPVRAEPAEEKVLADLSRDWTITSFTGKNPPAAPLGLATLAGWNESADEKLRFFAGRAVYEKSLASSLLGLKGGERVRLDLGDVREIVNVWANGEFLGCLWEAPYRVELPASALVSPTLELRLEVVNTWPNRLIGDAKARKQGASEPIGKDGVPEWVLADRPDSGTGIFTWMNWMKGWTADDEPRPAGLLGPVRLTVSSDAG